MILRPYLTTLELLVPTENGFEKAADGRNTAVIWTRFPCFASLTLLRRTVNSLLHFVEYRVRKVSF